MASKPDGRRVVIVLKNGQTAIAGLVQEIVDHAGLIPDTMGNVELPAQLGGGKVDLAMSHSGDRSVIYKEVV